MGWFGGNKKPKVKQAPQTVKVNESKEEVSAPENSTDDLSKDREKLIRVAATFLSNPKIENETLELKHAFLKRKGLTDAEIKQAFELYKEKVRLAQEEKELKEEIASYNTDSKSEDNLKAKIERAKKTNFLNIKDFKITSLPDEVFTLVNLKTLIISGNPIRGLPEKLSNLKELQVLHAANCQIEDGGFPESVASALVELKELNLSQNLLTNVDEFITKFPKLKMVNLSENDIMSIPEDAIYPESLTQINLQKNNLSTIPESFADLPNLKFLRISGNNFDQDMVDAINKQGPAALKKFFQADQFSDIVVNLISSSLVN